MKRANCELSPRASPYEGLPDRAFRRFAVAARARSESSNWYGFERPELDHHPAINLSTLTL